MRPRASCAFPDGVNMCAGNESGMLRSNGRWRVALRPAMAISNSYCERWHGIMTKIHFFTERRGEIFNDFESK